MTQILNLPFEHCNALNTHSKSESAVNIRVNTRSLKHIRIHHSTTHNLKPSGTLTDITPLPFANITTHIYLSRRLSKGKIGGAEANFSLLAKHFAGKSRTACFKSANETPLSI